MKKITDDKNVMNEETVDWSQLMQCYYDGKSKISHAKESIPDTNADNTLGDIQHEFSLGQKMVSDAKCRIVENLTPYVHHVIKKHFSRYEEFHMDLFQEGVVGILKGIDSYNPSRGKPTTYFHPYIIHEMFEFIAININRTSNYYTRKIIDVRHAMDLFESSGKGWSARDISEYTDIPLNTVKNALMIIDSSKEISYDDEAFQIVNQLSMSPEEQVISNECRQAIREILSSKLTKLEMVILALKHGLFSVLPMKYVEIAELLHMDTYVVKKHERKAVSVLFNHLHHVLKP